MNSIISLHPADFYSCFYSTLGHLFPIPSQLSQGEARGTPCTHQERQTTILTHLQTIKVANWPKCQEHLEGVLAFTAGLGFENSDLLAVRRGASHSTTAPEPIFSAPVFITFSVMSLRIVKICIFWKTVFIFCQNCGNPSGAKPRLISYGEVAKITLQSCIMFPESHKSFDLFDIRSRDSSPPSPEGLAMWKWKATLFNWCIS